MSENRCFRQTAALCRKRAPRYRLSSLIPTYDFNKNIKYKGASMEFKMSIEDNFSSYIDPDTGLALFIDTFDNHEFDVRIGSIEDSTAVGTITADTDKELNEKLMELFLSFPRSAWERCTLFFKQLFSKMTHYAITKTIPPIIQL